MNTNIMSLPTIIKASWGILSFMGLTILLASSHWILIRIYAIYCAPSGMYGLVYTWFSTGSPVCQFINHLQVGLANNFVGIWAAAAAAIVLRVASLLTCAKSSIGQTRSQLDKHKN